MAETSSSPGDLGAALATAPLEVYAVAPRSLNEWARLQSMLTVTLPAQMHDTTRVLQSAVRLLAGRAG